MKSSAPTDAFAWNQLVRGRHGVFLANPRDIYLGRAMTLYGEYAEVELDLLRQLLTAGDVVVEAGANIGLHTVPFAHMVGERGAVLAFEPQRIAYQTLCANLVLNGMVAAVKPIHAALGEAAGSVNVPMLNPWREENFGGLSLETFNAGEPTPMMRLDDMGLAALRLLKADVEGMEDQVLAGAADTIRRLQPILYLEADRDEKVGRVHELLAKFGYRAWWHFPPLFNTKNHAGNRNNIYGTTMSINLLAVPPQHASLAERLLPGAQASPPETWGAAMKRIKAR